MDTCPVGHLHDGIADHLAVQQGSAEPVKLHLWLSTNFVPFSHLPRADSCLHRKSKTEPNEDFELNSDFRLWFSTCYGTL